MGETRNERLPMGQMGMNPLAAQASMRMPMLQRPNPSLAREAEDMALAQRRGIGSVPPVPGRKKGGRK
jgi:hypothetical protein